MCDGDEGGGGSFGGGDGGGGDGGAGGDGGGGEGPGRVAWVSCGALTEVMVTPKALLAAAGSA
eukprot:2226167-Prymnesium_polylepis.1